MTRPLGPSTYRSAEARRFERLEAEIKRLAERVEELERATSPHVLAGYVDR